MSWIFRLAKSNGETWFEHSKNTFHVGRVLWSLCEGEISKYFSKEEYLWCCLFHDVGKFLWQEFGDKHTPYTEKALDIFIKQKEYANLLRQFSLPDLASDKRLLDIIREHHDNKAKGSEFVTLADCIASSDFGYVSELDTSTYSNYLKFLISDLKKLQGYHLVEITFPDSSYLDRVKFGQLFLIKMLRESIWNLCEKEKAYYLFDTQNGCKILIKKEPKDLKTEVDAAFREYLFKRFEDFDVLQLIGGQPQASVRLRQYIFSERHDLILDKLFQSCMVKVLGEIARSAKIKELRQNEMETWTMDELVGQLVQYTGVTRENIVRLTKYDSTWLGVSNDDKTLLTEGCERLRSRCNKAKKTKKKRIEDLITLFETGLEEKPVIISLLVKEKIIQRTTPYIDCFVGPIAQYFIYKNSFLKNDERYPELQIEPLLSFISVNGQLNPGLYATKKGDICAGCGVFTRYMEAGQVVTGFSKQQWRESIGRPESPQPLCALCYFSLLLYTYLTGTEKGQNIRPVDASYLTLMGINILKDVEAFVEGDSVFSEEVVKRLENFKKQFNLQRTVVYLPHQIDLNTIVYSIIPKTDAYRDYPSIQKYSILSEVRDMVQASDNILGVAIQDKPEVRGPTVIKTQEGELDLEKINAGLDLFNFIRSITYDPKSLIYYLRLWQQNAALALSKLIKDKKYVDGETIRKGLEMIQKGDKYFDLAKKLWQTVTLLGQLPSGGGSKYTVGKPVKKFKGTPESLDYHTNFLLKECKCNLENKEKALKVAEELRKDLNRLDQKEQKEFGNYVKKTTHLFNALAWQEINIQKGGKQNEQAK